MYFVMNIMNGLPEALGMLFAILGIVFIIIAIIAIVMQLLYSFGLYRMGQRAGVSNSWLAFIPPFNLYVMGKILGPNRINFLGQEVIKPELALPILPFAMGIVSSLTSSASGALATLLGLISLVTNIGGSIFLLFCNYQFLKMYKGERAKLPFILSIILPFAWPIIVFSMRNDDPVDGGYNDYGDYNSYGDYNNYNNYYNNY
jgi:hypothetical protein